MDFGEDRFVPVVYISTEYEFRICFYDCVGDEFSFLVDGDRITERAASWTEDLMVSSSIPAAARGYLIFPAQKDVCHQGAHP